MKTKRRVILGVTAPESLGLLGPLPRMLRDAGWETYLVSDPSPSTLPATPHGVLFKGIPMARQPSPIKDLRAALLWLQLISNVRPNVVSVGTPKASFLGILAAWLCRVPHRVYVLRGLRLETITGPSRLLFGLIENATALCATDILAVSKSLAKKYVAMGFCDESKISVLGSGSSHGVDTSRFGAPLAQDMEITANKLGLEPGLPVLGFVGRFSVDKGARTILKMREKLVASNIDHEILIVGPIEDSKETLKKMNYLGRSVKQTGRIDNVESFYPLMTLLILPTKREGFPNVTLEAGAAGIPTVTTSATGAIDSVIDGVTGIVVDSESDLAFAEAVLRLLRSPGLTAELGRAARKRVNEEFEEHQVCARVVDYYEGLVSSK